MYLRSNSARGSAVSVVSSREFNRDVGAAKRAAAAEPVFITDRGDPAFVLLSIAEYRRLTERGLSLVERLRMDGGEDIELDLGDRHAIVEFREFDL
jgi:prevent-host-death family protein